MTQICNLGAMKEYSVMLVLPFSQAILLEARIVFIYPCFIFKLVCVVSAFFDNCHEQQFDYFSIFTKIVALFSILKLEPREEVKWFLPFAQRSRIPICSCI